MIVVVDERELVKDGYTSLFGREGVPSTGFDPREFGGRQHPDGFGSDLLRQALGLALLCWRKTIGPQHAFAPREIEPVGQDQDQYKQSQHGFRIRGTATPTPGAR